MSEQRRRREIRRYQRVCRLIDRLLDEGRLEEAQRLNVEARKLFKRLYGQSDQDRSERPQRGR
jgi:hypothetical protein